MYLFALFYIQNHQKSHSQKYLDQIIFLDDDMGGFRGGLLAASTQNCENMLNST